MQSIFYTAVWVCASSHFCLLTGDIQSICRKHMSVSLSFDLYHLYFHYVDSKLAINLRWWYSLYCFSFFSMLLFKGFPPPHPVAKQCLIISDRLPHPQAHQLFCPPRFAKEFLKLLRLWRRVSVWWEEKLRMEPYEKNVDSWFYILN